MKTGTLQELNVKPGDVVECVKSVRERTVDPHHDLSVFPTYYNTSASMFRIISRAPDDIPKIWRNMTDAEKGALLLAHHEGEVIEGASHIPGTSRLAWNECPNTWKPICNGIYRIKPKPVREVVTNDTPQKMSAREAMAYTKVRYKETLKYLAHIEELETENARLWDALEAYANKLEEHEIQCPNTTKGEQR